MNRYPQDGSRPGLGLRDFFLMAYQNLFELICLNVFFLVSCLPVVTVPWASAALADAVTAMSRDEDTHLLRRYWRRLFHPDPGTYGTALPVLLLPPVLGLGLLIYIGAGQASALLWIGCGFNAVAFAGSILYAAYVLSWMICSGETGKKAWKRAFWIAMARLLHSAAPMAAVFLIWILCLRHFRRWWILFFLIVISLSALICARCADRNIRAFLAEAAEESNDDGGERTCIDS